MNRGSPSTSLTRQLLGNVYLSLLAAALAFIMAFLLFTIADIQLVSHGLTRPLAAAVEETLVSQVRVSVEQQKITGETVDRLTTWCRQSLIHLTLYRGNDLIYETPGDVSPRGDDKSFQSEHDLTLYDGTEVRAVFSYNLDRTIRNWEFGISIVVAFVVFSLSFTALVHSKLRYIKVLKEELDAMAGGELERPVTVLGRDELGELAAGMDEMRRSFLTHLREEDRIRSANSQLVTAMSHDLRTPLTSLMACLELLDRRKYADEDQMRHLVRQSLARTRDIRALTDKLFEYFLVYATEWEQPEFEMFDADSLIVTLWQEYAFTLEREGFRVELDGHPLEGSLQVNLPLLRRAFDNVYANLLKYADPSRSISVSWGREGNTLVLRASNAVSPQRDRKESTSIGLNTCRRVLRLHGGGFDTAEEDGVFTASLTLPLSLHSLLP